MSPFPRVLAVIIAASEQATSSRGLAACRGPTAIPVESVSRPAASHLQLGELGSDALRERERARQIGSGEDDRELLAADSADHVRGSNRGPEHVRDLDEQLVADPVAVDVVHLLEVVQVEHDEGDGVVLCRGTHDLLPKPIVERAMVVEAGERVGRRLVLEPRADVRVVDGERRGVAEACGEVELLCG